MVEFIVMLLIGVAFCVIGGINCTGNLSLMHSYHTKRVKEEDKKPMGKRVGIGMILIGGTMIIASVLTFLYEQTKIVALAWVGNGILLAGFIVGLAIILITTIKYNKGLF